MEEIRIFEKLLNYCSTERRIPGRPTQKQKDNITQAKLCWNRSTGLDSGVTADDNDGRKLK
jgi:hypothetical protein